MGCWLLVCSPWEASPTQLAPPLLPPFVSFCFPQEEENLHIKTIANMAYMTRTDGPHHALYSPGYYAGACRRPAGWGLRCTMAPCALLQQLPPPPPLVRCRCWPTLQYTPPRPRALPCRRPLLQSRPTASAWTARAQQSPTILAWRCTTM